jgi:hypothetical protein
MVADPEIIQAQVFPLFRSIRLLPTTAQESPITPELIAEGLQELQAANLIILYGTSEESYLVFPKWEVHQTGLHRRTASQFPEPPGSSRKFPEVPGQERARARNGTEQNMNRTEQQHAETAQQKDTWVPPGPEGKGAAVSSQTVPEGREGNGKREPPDFAALAAKAKAIVPEDKPPPEPSPPNPVKTIGELAERMRM